MKENLFSKLAYLSSSLLILSGILGCGLVSNLIATPTPTVTLTPTPTITLTTTPTPTLTSTPTLTPTTTPTPNPFSETNLKKIILQEDDVLKFATDIGFKTRIEAIRINPSMASWEFSNLTAIPNHVAARQSAFDFNYVPDSPNNPIYKGEIQNTIVVFKTSQDAHRFFIEDTNDINRNLIKNAGKIPYIGDETIALRGWKNGYWPVGVVIWRYENVYVFLYVVSISDYTQIALFDLARSIQARIGQALGEK